MRRFGHLAEHVALAKHGIHGTGLLGQHRAGASHDGIRASTSLHHQRAGFGRHQVQASGALVHQHAGAQIAAHSLLGRDCLQAVKNGILRHGHIRHQQEHGRQHQVPAAAHFLGHKPGA